MLIIAIGHGPHVDPFTCSCKASPDEVDYTSFEDVRDFIFAHHKLTNAEVDEIIVVEADDIQAHYTGDDGLGEEIEEDEKYDDTDVDDDFANPER